jgi:hypothetical protein
VQNYLGVEIQHHLNQLKFGKDGAEVLFNDNEQQLNTMFNRANFWNGQVYPVTRTFMFTGQNSNINDLIGLFPEEIDISSLFQINPLGNISNYSDFVFTDQGFLLIADAQVPLRFKTNNLIFSDTLDLSFQFDSLVLNEKYAGTIDLHVINTFPSDIDLKVYFLDENQFVVDSLFSDFQRFPYNPNLTVYRNLTEVSNTRLQNWQNTVRFVKVEARLNSSDFKTLTNTDYIFVKPVVHLTYEAHI